MREIEITYPDGSIHICNVHTARLTRDNEIVIEYFEMDRVNDKINHMFSPLEQVGEAYYIKPDKRTHKQFSFIPDDDLTISEKILKKLPNSLKTYSMAVSSGKASLANEVEDFDLSVETPENAIYMESEMYVIARPDDVDVVTDEVKIFVLGNKAPQPVDKLGKDVALKGVVYPFVSYDAMPLTDKQKLTIYTAANRKVDEFRIEISPDSNGKRRFLDCDFHYTYCIDLDMYSQICKAKALYIDASGNVSLATALESSMSLKRDFSIEFNNGSFMKANSSGLSQVRNSDDYDEILRRPGQFEMPRHYDRPMPPANYMPPRGPMFNPPHGEFHHAGPRPPRPHDFGPGGYNGPSGRGRR